MKLPFFSIILFLMSTIGSFIICAYEEASPVVWLKHEAHVDRGLVENVLLVKFISPCSVLRRISFDDDNYTEQCQEYFDKSIYQKLIRIKYENQIENRPKRFIGGFVVGYVVSNLVETLIDKVFNPNHENIQLSMNEIEAKIESDKKNEAEWHNKQLITNNAIAHAIMKINRNVEGAFKEIKKIKDAMGQIGIAIREKKVRARGVGPRAAPG